MSNERLTAAQRNDACVALRGSKSKEVVEAMRHALGTQKTRACAGSNLQLAGAIDALKDALGDDDPNIRALAARELGKFQTPELLGSIAKAAADPNQLVAANALHGLMEYQDGSALPFLPHLAKSGGMVGTMSLNWLAQRNQPQALSIARQFFRTGETTDRLAAIRIIGQMGDSSDLPELKKLAATNEELSARGRGFGFMPAVSVGRAARTAIDLIESKPRQ